MSGYVADLEETVWSDDAVPRMPVFCADYEVEVEQKLNQLALTLRPPPVDQDNYVARPTFSWILRRSEQGCDAAVGRHVGRDAGGIVGPCSCGQLKRNSSPAVPCCDQRRLDTVPEFRVPPTGWRCCPHGHGHRGKTRKSSLTPPRSLSQSSVRDDVETRSLQQPQVLYDTPNPHAVPVPSSVGVLPLMSDPDPRPGMTKKIQGSQPQQRHRRQHRYRRSFSTGDQHPAQPCCYSLERRPRNPPPASSSTDASTASRLQPWMLRSQSFSDVRCRSSTGSCTAVSSSRPPLPCSGTSTSTSALYGTADGPFAAHSRNNGSLRRSMRALSGSWRNLIKQVGGMNNRSANNGGGKSAQARRVAPPTVPEPTVNCCNGSTAANRHSGGSYSSSCGSHGASDSVESAPQLSQSQQRLLSTNSAHDGASNAGRCSNSTAQSSHHSTAFPFSQTQVTGSPSPAGSSGSGKEFVPHFHNHIYQHCEDLGIDVQSPGRDSPCSVTTCRHSTSSLDSGRASSSCTAATVNPAVHPSTLHSGPPSDTPAAVRLSGQSFDSANSAGFRQSYHSSNSSLGSNGRDDVISQLNVAQMLADGLPDLEVLTCWLTDLRLQQYYHLFVEAGYDMATISRMTPEDLTAIGVTRPAHRRKLTAEIARMSIDDRIPDFIPHSLEEWLQLLQLQQYSQLLRAQGYTCVHEVTAVTWEDLEEIGISRLGHQKKITLAIKRAKDILTGRRVPSIYQHQYTTQEITIAAPCTPTRDGGATTTATSEFRTFHQPSATRSCRGSPAHRLVAPPPSEPLPHTHLQGSDSPPPPPAPQTHLQYTQQRQMLQQDGWLLQHCSGESAAGDVTPTNEPMTQSGVTSLLTAASQQKIANRPVAKIPASARATSVTSDTYKVHSEKVLAQQRLFPPAPSPLRMDSSGSEMSSDGEQAPLSPSHICRTSQPDDLIPPAKLTSGDVESAADCAFPFANDNAGTIRQRQQSTSTHNVTVTGDVISATDTSTGCVVEAAASSDVLGDIGSMLADLTDELDAMLQLERCTATAQ